MKQKITLTIVLILIALGIYYLDATKNSAQNVSGSVNNHQNNYSVKALNLQLQNLSGQNLILGDFVGQKDVLILNSWATWCPFCINELADFDKLQKEFGNDIKIIAINRGESINTIQSYFDTLQIQSDILFLQDPADNFYRSIQGFSMPETLFINKNGDLILHKRGVIHYDEMKNIVTENL